MSDQPFLFQPQVNTLANSGLNLIAVFDLQQLPSEIVSQLDAKLLSSKPFSRLVLLGNGGTQLWENLDLSNGHLPNPIDTYSLACTQTFIDSISAEHDQHLVLYPQTNLSIPLQQLGQLAGWGTPSPIGNSISPKYGLWFAFRAAFLTSVQLPISQPESHPSPCITCIDKPCQSACPAEAVKESARQFDLNTCISHRLKPNSLCANSCLARLACPIGTEHRYPPTAIHYLYNTSLSAIEAWQNNANST